MAGRRLERYRRKRDFRTTPEPPPEAPRAHGRTAALQFVVHKHDATRLHYDLRLQIGDALASWAVPRGPSLDPGERRLAVETEDHPLAYGSFEGRIPDGEYGAGDSILWDRGTWEPVISREKKGGPARTARTGRGATPNRLAEQMREKGHIEFVLHGEKLHGRWHLVRTRGGGPGKTNWLLFKAHDDAADPREDIVARRPESVKSGRRLTRGPLRRKTMEAPHPDPLKLLLRVWPPMLATLSTEEQIARRKQDFVLERKYDGYRALAAISGGRVSLQSRNGLDLSPRFPALFRALGELEVAEAVLDGEVVAFDARGRESFQKLQNEGDDVVWMVFDLLWLDGEDLRTRPLEDRRDLLESVLGSVVDGWRRTTTHRALPIQLAERFDVPLHEALASARKRGEEGVIAKRRGSRYAGGRAREWLKAKVLGAQELAVVGYTPISSGESMIGALHLGYRDGTQWRWAGKVGTGFTDALRRDLFRVLSGDRIDKSVATGAPRSRNDVWVRPRLVAQIAFGEWTRDGHLRHPRFQGLRDDKSPEEITREAPP